MITHDDAIRLVRIAYEHPDRDARTLAHRLLDQYILDQPPALRSATIDWLFRFVPKRSSDG